MQLALPPCLGATSMPGTALPLSLGITDRVMASDPSIIQPLAPNATRVGLTYCNYTEKDRAYALSVYAETNNLSEASRKSGIAKQTIHYWLQDDETLAFVDDIRTVLRSRCAFELVELTALSFRAAKDSLLNGDEVVLKDGSIVRRKVSGRDAMMMGAIAMDKHILLTATAEHDAQVAKALNHLADSLLDSLTSKVAEALEVKASGPNGVGYLG